MRIVYSWRKNNQTLAYCRLAESVCSALTDCGRLTACLCLSLTLSLPYQIVPVGGGVDESRNHQRQGGHLDGAEQRHHQIQPGDGRRQANCKRTYVRREV